MNRYLVMVAALTILLGGCGREEEAPAVPEEEAAVVEAPEAPPEAPEMSAVDQAGETVEEAIDSVTDEAVDAAEKAMEDAAAPGQADLGRGKEVYDMACFVCHAMGIAGAPKFGDEDAWGPRIAQGMDILYAHSINGFQGKTGVMPPKGGRTDLSDEDVRQAVRYMVDQVK
jgi:cytochrome c5